MSKTKVLWLINGLGMGGAERLLVDALPYLDRASFDYEVAYLRPDKDDLTWSLRKAGLPVFCVARHGAFDVGLPFRLAQLLRERKVTLLHSHLPYAGVLGRIAARLAGVRALVYTEHNVAGSYHPLISVANRLTYWLDDATIAVSAPVENSALRWPLLRPRGLQVIENGVATNWLEAPESTQGLRESLGIPSHHLVIGNVAHLRPEKGHGFLLDAMEKVVRKEPNVTCVIVGRGKGDKTMARLVRHAAALGLKRNVVFTGFREDARRIMRIFDIFTLSSLYEGLPVALLEAMALGVPPVVTAVGGVPSVVSDGEDGLLVPPRDAEGLANALLRVLQDGRLRTDLSLRAVEKVRTRFGMEQMVRAVEKVYHEVLGERIDVSFATAPTSTVVSE